MTGTSFKMLFSWPSNLVVFLGQVTGWVAVPRPINDSFTLSAEVLFIVTSILLKMFKNYRSVGSFRVCHIKSIEMSNKETKTRVASAFRAMKAIGISEDKVKPVLKSLLKLYDKNWALIEEENYRALADAIFDRDENEAEERSKKIVNNEAAEQSKKMVNTQTDDYLQEEALVAEEPEQPLKRLRLRHRDGQTSSNMNNSGLPKTPLVTPKEEPNEMPETHLPKINGSLGIVESPQPNSGNITIKPQDATCQSVGKNKGKQPISPKSQAHPMRLRDRGTGVVSPPITSRKKRPAPESSSHPVSLKEPKIEPGIPLLPEKENTASRALIVPKDEPLTDDMPRLEVPGAIIHPGTSNGGESPSRRGMVKENCAPESLALSVSEKETADGTAALDESRNNGGLAMISAECSSNQEIASSPFGEVKIYLSCDLASRRPDFCMPSVEAVLKAVEDKYLKSPRTSDQDISMMDLMKEMCQCFLNFGTDSNSQSPKAMDVTPTIHTASKSSLNGSVYTRSRAKAKKPLLPPPCSDINDAQQPNEIDAGDQIVTDRENQENCDEETNSQSLEVVQQPEVTPENIRSLTPVIDIAKGQEKVVITLVNEVNDECPPSFYYIPQNAAFQNAYVNFSLARIGDKNCCATCFDGLVKEELLKEAISMNRDPKKHCQFFCKECPLERSKGDDIIEPCKGHLVFMTPGGKGWGLRTLEDLPKGTFVCEYVGEVLTNAELFERVSRTPKGEKHSYPVLLDADWCAEGVLKDEEALCLDATYYGNVARFINHRCYDSNLVEIPVEVETPDHHYYHLAFFTTRKVKAMEELTWDYGIDFDDHEHPIKAFRCQCASKFCRNIKRSSKYEYIIGRIFI
ncbi:hypothetical protein DH2020_001261 [Rehmannia glutinosa]|uniref:SET domain-containing protein n=1 Tax=Rehmannia glutinosa TaxID=99300 RepID=A0ABR0XYU0_REHGL